MLKPNKKNIRLWVEALRSGKYKQGFATLRNQEGTSYCCLGVACEVARSHGIKITPSCAGYRTIELNTFALLSTAALPEPVSKWLGLSDDPIIAGNKRAIEANDNLRWTFNKIAYAISKKYLGSAR